MWLPYLFLRPLFFPILSAMNSISANELFDLMTTANNITNIKKWIYTEDLVKRVTDRAKKGRAFCCVSAPVDINIENSWDDIKEQLAEVFPNCWFHYQNIYQGELDENYDCSSAEYIGLFILIGWDKKSNTFVKCQEYRGKNGCFALLDEEDFAIYFH